VLTALVASLVYTFLSFGVFTLVGALLYQGIVSVYLFAIVRRASMGRRGAPAPTDNTDFDDFLASGVRFILAFTVPLLLLLFLAAKLAPEPTGMVEAAGDPLAIMPLGVKVAGVLWLLYLPSSLILAAHGTGCLGGLNLLAGVRLISRAPVGYGLLCLALVPAIGVQLGASIVGGLVAAALPFGGIFVVTALGMFPLAMGGRLLGLFMYHYEYELGLA
jgi:hypothetical protein